MKTLFVAALLALCTITRGPATAAEPLVVRIGFADVGPANQPYSGNGIAAIAHARGYITDEFKGDPNIKFQFSFHRGGPALNEAMANKQLDFGQIGDLPGLIGRSNGLRTKLLLGSDSRQNLYLGVTPKSGIASLKDIRGRKIALFRGTNLQLAANRLLDANKMTEKDVRIINMNFYDSFAALAAGDVDGSFGEADLAILEQKGVDKIIWNSKKEPNYTRATLFSVTEDFDHAHPQIVARVVKAIVRGAKWAEDEANREEVFKTLALNGRSIEVFRAEFANQTMNYRLSPIIDPFLMNKLAVSAKIAKDIGLIRNEVNTSDWFELKYLNAAITSLGYGNVWKSYGPDGQPIAP